MVVVTFRLEGAPKTLKEVFQSLKEISEKVRKLDGCLGVNVYKDPDNETIFFLVEEWQSKRHLDDHMKSDLFSALVGIKGLLIKEPEVKFMNEY